MGAQLQWVTNSLKKSQDKNWGVGGQREFDENFKCKNSALTNIPGESTGRYQNGLLRFLGLRFQHSRGKEGCDSHDEHLK